MNKLIINPPEARQFVIYPSYVTLLRGRQLAHKADCIREIALMPFR